MKALRQLERGQALHYADVPVPTTEPGTAVVKIIAAGIISYTREVYNQTRPYPYPTPITVGSSAIARIDSVGPDATSLKSGQLVLFDVTVRSRDKPSDVFLGAVHQGFSAGSAKLMSHFRDGAFAEYMRMPLENFYPLNESVLLGSPSTGGLGYAMNDLLYLSKLVIPYGGLADIGLRPGETIIIGPATGGFGSAAVHVALSLGARVVALGRNQETLAKVKEALSAIFPPGRLITAPILPEPEPQLAAIKTALESFNCPDGADCFFDISPPFASKSAHFKASILSLRHSGRVSLMGGQLDDVPIPHMKVMHSNLSLRGKWMYERQDVRDLIKLVENGVVPLKLGKETDATTKAFKLEDWSDGFDFAADKQGMGVGAYFQIKE